MWFLLLQIAALILLAAGFGAWLMWWWMNQRFDAVARSRDQFFYLLCKTDSAWVAAQHGRQARLLPGDLVLVDSRHCYEFHFGESCDTVSLELPTAWVERWLPDRIGL